MLVIIAFQRILKFFNWSRLVELSSSDEIKMFYTEHDFQVDLENLRVQLEISCRENTTLLLSDRLPVSILQLLFQLKIRVDNHEIIIKKQDVRDKYA